MPFVNSKLPEISIVTVCYKDRNNLTQTLASVARLKALREGVELVVVDGGSEDGTTELIRSQGDLVDIYRSEPDGGVFDAMNKGVRLSTGKWVIFINAGDAIAEPGRFAELDLTPYGGVGLLYGNTHYEGVGVNKPFPEESLRYGMIMACHQSMLYNKEVLGEAIYYSDRFRLINEYDQVCRIVRGDYGTAYIDMPIAYFMGGGISSSVNWEARKARYYYVARHYGMAGLYTTAAESLGWRSLPPRRS